MKRHQPHFVDESSQFRQCPLPNWLVASLVFSGWWTAVAPAAAQWGQQYKLNAFDTVGNDIFGYSVAISGNNAVVGAQGRNAAYLVNLTNGNQTAKLNSPPQPTSELIGYSIALDGNVVVAGDIADDGAGGITVSGAAYPYQFNTAMPLPKLTPQDGVFADDFGNSVGVSGNIAIVGAPQHDNGAGNLSGSAYLFDVNSGMQLHELIPNDGMALAKFGASVAISGNRVIVGAPDSGFFYLTGAVYVFDVSTGNQLYKITPMDIGGGDLFGYSVAMDGTKAIIGAPHLFPDGAGAAYIYDVADSMVPTAGPKITAFDGQNGDEFGYAVDISGNNAIVGARRNSSSGAAYVYQVGTGDFQAKLLPSDGAPDDEFGSAVGISGNRAIVGAWSNDAAATYAGAAYVYHAPVQWIATGDGSWSQSAKWTDGVVPNGPGFGAILGNSILVNTATITLDTDVTLSSLVFDNALRKFMVDGPAHGLTMTYSGNTSTGHPEIEVLSGEHAITVDIHGTSGLAKTGSGTLILTGHLDYSGQTTFITPSPPEVYDSSTLVNEGSLTLQANGFQDNQLPTGFIYVASGAELRLKQFVFYTLEPGTGLYGSGDVIMEHTFSDTQLYFSPSTNVGGTLSIKADEVVNSGRIKPGFSPGVIHIEGDYIQNNDGALEIEVGGTTAGTFDVLEVTGLASLDGRLEVPIINGFHPVAGQQITFLTAGEVSGTFDALSSPNLAAVDPNLALKLDYFPHDPSFPTEVRLQFVAPSTAVQYVAPGTTANWHTASTWTAGNLPGTSHIINVQNTTVAARRVDVQDDNAFTHQFTISGTQNTMTVGVHGGVNLSATTSVTIGNRGVVELDSANLVSGAINVQAGGQLVGFGTVAGKLVVGATAGAQTATLSPGIPIDNPIQHLDVVGDYQQGPGGTLVIELTGADEGAFDTIGVSGQLKPGGTLRVDATSLASLTPGTMFHIITAGSLADDAVFAHVLTVGKNNIFFAPFYADPGAGGGAAGGSGSVTQGGVFLGGFLKGDMNMDGDVNGDDTAAFALALRDPDAYFNTRWPSGAAFIDGASAGSLDGYATDPINFVPNDRLDFDDINDFAALLAAGTGASTASIVAQIQTQLRVPEPPSALLLFASGCILVAARGRRITAAR